MKATFVYKRSPIYDDPHALKWSSQTLAEDWKTPLEESAEVLSEMIADMTAEEAAKKLESMGVIFRIAGPDTVEITLE